MICAGKSAEVSVLPKYRRESPDAVTKVQSRSPAVPGGARADALTSIIDRSGEAAGLRRSTDKCGLAIELVWSHRRPSVRL